MEFTEQDKILLLCAFDNGYSIEDCDNCILKDKCSSPDEGNGFNLMGQELLRKMGIIN